MYDGMGRGVQAVENIKCGELITVCELLVLSPQDTIIINKTDLQYYTFKYNEAQDCLVLGDGEIFNHSENANVSFNLVDRQSRKVMAFRAIQDIPEGQQLFIDYAADTQIDTENYLKNKSLI